MGQTIYQLVQDFATIHRMEHYWTEWVHRMEHHSTKWVIFDLQHVWLQTSCLTFTLLPGFQLRENMKFACEPYPGCYTQRFTHIVRMGSSTNKMSVGYTFHFCSWLCVVWFWCPLFGGCCLESPLCCSPNVKMFNSFHNMFHKVIDKSLYLAVSFYILLGDLEHLDYFSIQLGI